MSPSNETAQLSGKYPQTRIIYDEISGQPDNPNACALHAWLDVDSTSQFSESEIALLDRESLQEYGHQQAFLRTYRWNLFNDFLTGEGELPSHESSVFSDFPDFYDPKFQQPLDRMGLVRDWLA